jgi:TonB family protein
MEDGTVGYPRILQSYAPDVDAEVLRAVQGWRYKPATQQGQPVRVYLTISSQIHVR